MAIYGNAMREDAYIARLLDFVQRTYGLTALQITPAKRGFYGETWKLCAERGNYFVKLDYSAHQAIYEGSFPVVEHLCSHGIDFISRIVKTKVGSLSTRYEGAVLGVFDWIDGENIETDETKIPEYTMMAKVYSIPPCGGIPREDFSGNSAEIFFEKWARLDSVPLCKLFDAHREKLRHRAERLAYYCYYFFFYYLNEYLEGLDAHVTTEEAITGFFTSWAEARISYADRIN